MPFGEEPQGRGVRGPSALIILRDGALPTYGKRGQYLPQCYHIRSTQALAAVEREHDAARGTMR
jgi:hypothetical protein